MPEGRLSVRAVDAAAADATPQPMDERFPGTFEVVAEGVALQRLADALTQASGLPIFVATEVQELRTTLYHPGGSVGSVVQLLDGAWVELIAEEHRVSIRPRRLEAGGPPEDAPVSVWSIPLATDQIEHVQALWCEIAMTRPHPATLVGDAVVVTGPDETVGAFRRTIKQLFEAGGGAGALWSGRGTDALRNLPGPTPAPAGGSLQVSPILRRGEIDSLVNVSAEATPFAVFAVGVAEALGRPTVLDPRLLTTRVTLRLTAATSRDIDAALRAQWAAGPYDDGHGRRIPLDWRATEPDGCGFAWSGIEVRVIPMNSERIARQVAEAARPMLGPYGAILASGSALVVRDEPHWIRRIREFASNMRPPQQRSPSDRVAQ